MELKVFFTLNGFLIVAGIDGYAMDSSCRTHEGTYGDCIPLHHCDSLYKLALKLDLQVADILFIRRRKCGFANNIHYVCCLKEENRISRKSTYGICETPDGVHGLCQPVKGCRVLMNLIMSPTRTPNETSFLQKSQCGYVNRDFMACCPILLNEYEIKMETNTIKAETSSSPLCQTPSGAPGECIPIGGCQSLLNLVKKYNRTLEETTLLQQSKCGYANRNILVCCSLSKAEYHLDGTATEESMFSNFVFHNVTKEEEVVTENIVDKKSYTGPPASKKKLPSPPECGRADIGNRIFGGKETNIDEYPWTALLLYTNSNDDLDFLCGGSLINQNFVLTAAHCIAERDLPKDWYLTSVRLGEWNTKTEHDCEYDNNGKPFCAPAHRDIDVKSTTIHPQYNSNSKANDIALLRLAESVDYTDFISPVCLPLAVTQQSASYEGATAIIVGWGATEKSAHSEIKLKTIVTVMNATQCGLNNLRGRITIGDKQICAAGVGTDSCHGDSGGPLMLPEAYSYNGHVAYYLIGLVSFGTGGCGQTRTRGIYTRVGAYLQWIEENVVE